MKKRILILVSIVTCVLFLTGCKSSVTYTYKIETGDRVNIKLDTSDKYKLSKDLPFKISKDNLTLSQGTFITLDGYDEYLEEIKKDDKVKILEEKKKNGLEYIFYSYDDKYNYIIKISDSKTGVILANNVSEDSAKEVFDLLTISKVE